MNPQLSNTAHLISYDVYETLAERLDRPFNEIREVEIEDGEMLVVFNGWVEIDGKHEGSTNASYLTYALVSLNCTVYDAEGDEVASDYTDAEFKEYLLN
ncbi:MAG: hypothetical protein SNH63_02795 [Rikenellaceae bacterium]